MRKKPTFQKNLYIMSEFNFGQDMASGDSQETIQTIKVSLDQIGFANVQNLERMKTIYCQEDVKYMGTLLRNMWI